MLQVEAIILHAKLPKGCKHRNRIRVPARNSNSRKSASREAEPWLLIALPDLTLTARQLMMAHAKRMQIEESFRDLKSHRFGQAFEDSLTRKGPRIEILLLLSMTFRVSRNTSRSAATTGSELDSVIARRTR